MKNRSLICAVATTLILAVAPAGADALIVNRVNGADDRWSDAQVQSLTYCVSTGFGWPNHDRVVDAVAAGALKWESAAAVDFIYVPAEDGKCTTRNNNVIFPVRSTTDPSVYTSEFYPSTPVRRQRLLVNPSNTFNGDYPYANLLGHSLGHVLGFRHEHTRPESGTCFENNRWRALTPYDENSIMHYPWCNGGPLALTFSTLDAQGAATLYGPP